jgi:hypothetical protein
MEVFDYRNGAVTSFNPHPWLQEIYPNLLYPGSECMIPAHALNLSILLADHHKNDDPCCMAGTVCAQAASTLYS